MWQFNFVLVSFIINGLCKIAEWIGNPPSVDSRSGEGFRSKNHRLEWRNMNEAWKKKNNHAWKKGLAAAGVAAIIGLSGLSAHQYMELNKTTSILEKTTAVLSKTESTLNTTMDSLEKTMKKLNETKDKVAEQGEEMKKLSSANKNLSSKVEDQSDAIMELTTKLREAEQTKKSQANQIDQLEADLKKKRASRANSSAVSVKTVSAKTTSTAKTNTSTSVAGMTQFRSTAYSYGTTTASGTHVQEGRTIAVDPSVIPLGTKVRITCPSYPSINGVYTAEDTGRVIKGNIIDVYIQSHSKAIDYGRRTIYVEIL